jgi:hypothetical protein
MADPDPPDLFAAAGIILDGEPARTPPKRQKRARKLTPAEKAAAVRLEAGRRLWGPQSPGMRTRVGEPRDLAPAQVLAFPLHRNPVLVAKVIERLPHGYAPDLDAICRREAYKLEKRLKKKGMSQKSARKCAKELLHEAYAIRVRDAHHEAGVL